MNAHGPNPCASCWHVAAQATLDAYHEPQPNDPAFYEQPGAVVPAPLPEPDAPCDECQGDPDDHEDGCSQGWQ